MAFTDVETAQAHQAVFADPTGDTRDLAADLDAQDRRDPGRQPAQRGEHRVDRVGRRPGLELHEHHVAHACWRDQGARSGGGSQCE